MSSEDKQVILPGRYRVLTELQQGRLPANSSNKSIVSHRQPDLKTEPKSLQAASQPLRMRMDREVGRIAVKDDRVSHQRVS